MTYRVECYYKALKTWNRKSKKLSTKFKDKNVTLTEKGLRVSKGRTSKGQRIQSKSSRHLPGTVEGQGPRHKGLDVLGR